MTEQFTSIRFEVEISGTWINLTPDVMDDPAPKGTRGIQGNEPLDYIADEGNLTFSLKNGKNNSVATLGYYSPGHASCLSGWTTGLPVRLSFSYKGITRYWWYGRIKPDGIKVFPGSVGDAERRVDVTCYDYMGQATYHTLKSLTPTTNINVEDAMALILAAMPVAPLVSSNAHTLPSALPYLFDNLSTETTALSEMYKLTLNHNAPRVFVRGDDTGGETFTYASRAGFAATIPTVAATNKLLLETGDKLLLEDGSFLLLDETETLTISNTDMQPGTDFSFGKDVYNYITVTDFPRRFDDTAVVLYTLDSAQSLAAGASVTFFGTYRDPSGKNTKTNADVPNMIAPVASTDYFAYANSDGTGTNYTANMTVVATYFAAEVKFVVSNTGGATFYFGGPDITFQCRGIGIYLEDSARVVASDTTSIATHGTRPLNVEWKYAYTGVATSTYASAFLSTYKDPFTKLDTLKLHANLNEKNMYTFMFWLPRWAVATTEATTGYSASPFLQGASFEIRDGKYVYWDVITSPT